MPIFDPYQAFRAGQAMGSGQSSIASFVSSVTDRLNEHLKAKQLAEAELGTAVAKEKAISPFKTQQALDIKRSELQMEDESISRRNAELDTQFGSGTQQPTQAADSSGIPQTGYEWEPSVDSSGRKSYKRVESSQSKFEKQIYLQGQKKSASRSGQESGAKSVIRDLDSIESYLLPEKGGSPGNLILAGNPFSTKQRDLGNALNSLITGKSFSEGGKNLTATELKRIEKLAPSRLDIIAYLQDPKPENLLALKNKLNRLRSYSIELLGSSQDETIAEMDESDPSQWE